MRIISHKKLREFYQSAGREDSRVALERWYEIAENADWKSLSEIKADFPAAYNVGNRHYVLDIGGNRCPLAIIIKFVLGNIYIRWIGTHNEYGKIDCSTI